MRGTPCPQGVFTATNRFSRLDAKRPGSLNWEPGHDLTIDPNRYETGVAAAALSPVESATSASG
jgi:hypothetical protein